MDANAALENVLVARAHNVRRYSIGSAVELTCSTLFANVWRHLPFRPRSPSIVSDPLALWLVHRQYTDHECCTEMELITLLAAKFAEEQGAYRLLIVDSILALFRVDFSGRGELSERQQK